MRLSPHEVNLIKTVVAQSCEPRTLYLFGSRANDDRKGGDIDLFLEPSQTMTLKQQLALQYQLTNACDAQVDLLVKNPEKNETPFFQIARQGIRLL